jgi:pimeloyl-ACP methyl ester carboxylesterase
VKAPSITTERVTVGGYRTRALQVRGSGPVTIFLHGYGDWADTWRGVLAEYERRGRAAVAYDLPGFGESAPRPAGSMLAHLDAFTSAAVTRHSDTGPPVLVGNSLGALVSIRAAAGGGDDVAAVVAVDQPALGGSRVARAFQRDRASWAMRTLSRDLRVPRRLLHGGSRVALRAGLYADRRQADRNEVDEFVRRMYAAHRTGGSVVREIRSLALDVREPYEYARVVAPLLIVHGAKDRVIPVRASVRLHDAVPGSELVVLARCGHCPQLDDPRGLAALVLEFVGRRGRTPG